jgi:restriction endonuclease S subunit
MLRVYKHLSRGSTNRRRLNVEKFLSLSIPVPVSIELQEEVANTLRDIEQGIAKMRERSGGIDEELEDLTGSALHYVFRSRTEEVSS